MSEHDVKISTLKRKIVNDYSVTLIPPSKFLNPSQMYFKGLKIMDTGFQLHATDSGFYQKSNQFSNDEAPEQEPC